MKSNRLDVFAASQQWAGAVKVVSRGTSRSRASVTKGNWWSVSAAENDGERGGTFPTVRHEYLFGLIRTSHSPAQVQAEEREERRRIDWDRGKPFSRHLQKGNQNHRDQRADHIYTVVSGYKPWASSDWRPDNMGSEI